MKFDIILPTIGRDSLGEAIDSVIAQDFQDWQLYVMCEGFEWPIKDNRIHIIPNPEIQHNDSGAWARNHAIKFGELPWIAYIDDDDIWLPNHLSVISSLLEANPQATMIRTAGQEFSWKRKSPRSKQRIRKLSTVNSADILTVGMAHTRELFKLTNGWQTLDNHDKILWNEMIQMGGIPISTSMATFQFQR